MQCENKEIESDFVVIVNSLNLSQCLIQQLSL